MTTTITTPYLVETDHGDGEHHLRAFDMRSLKEWLVKDIQSSYCSGDKPSLVRLSRYAPKPPGAGNAGLDELRIECLNPDARADDSDFIRYDYNVMEPGLVGQGDDEWLAIDAFSVRIDGRA
jgi:hypothetical protein